LAANGNGLMSAGSRIRLRFAPDERLVAFVRRGDPAAFEALYERHSRELLSFCVYVLGSRQDAEDAVQTTFAAAYRALLAHERPVALRPWLFTIARNDCLSILRKRRPWSELNGEPALGGDPFRELELREEVRHTLAGLLELPERQRAALVMAELHGLSHSEIGTVLDVRPEQVKAYVYQARSHLMSERRARDADCAEIREELATAHGATLLKRRLRRHVRSCEGCRAYADGVARQRRHLGALLPWGPSLVLKTRALEQALMIRSTDPTYARGAAVGGSLAGAAAEVAGGSVKGLLAKVAVGIACIGASACAGVSIIGAPILPEEGHSSALASATPPGVRVSNAALQSGTPAAAAAAPALAGHLARGPRGQPGAETEEQLPPAALQVLRALDRGGSADAGPGTPGSDAYAAGQVASAAGEAHQHSLQERQRASGEEHARKAEEREERQLKIEARRRANATGGKTSKEERLLQREEDHEEHHEERQLQRELTRRERPEERPSGPPGKGKEQRQQEREERRREHAEPRRRHRGRKA
jgi:RNA polymerase sigma factor (sigma-70 family)